MVALEIASKSTDSDNAISNLMRHIGVAVNLDCIQIMKYDMINDKVEIEFQWWKENDGDYNVVFTDKKSGYYEHNDLVLFKKRFQKDNIFKYTPAFKEEFTQKYRNILGGGTRSNDIFIKYRKRRCILCCLLSVLGQTTYLGKERI